MDAELLDRLRERLKTRISVHLAEATLLEAQLAAVDTVVMLLLEVDGPGAVDEKPAPIIQAPAEPVEVATLPTRDPRSVDLLEIRRVILERTPITSRGVDAQDMAETVINYLGINVQDQASMKEFRQQIYNARTALKEAGALLATTTKRSGPLKMAPAYRRWVTSRQEPGAPLPLLKSAEEKVEFAEFKAGEANARKRARETRIGT